MKPLRPLESAILAQCLKLLSFYRIPAWRINSGAVAGEYNGKKRFIRFNGAKGCSDILGVLPGSGRFLAIETKRPGGRLTADQAAFLDMIRQSGGLALVVHSVSDLDEALKMEGVGG